MQSKSASHWGIAAVITYSLCGVIKDRVGRLRPYEAIAGSYYKESGQWERNPMYFVATQTKGESFPSRHAAGSTAICLGLILMLGKRMRRWQKGILLLLPLMVSWSRLYLGKHYVSDVVAGIVLGAMVVGILWLLWRYTEQHFFDSR